MRYHTVKMEDLNKLIRELWVNIYTGGGQLSLLYILS